MPAGPGDERATGGTISYVGDYVVHVFTSDGTFSPDEEIEAEVLAVGGGAGGGSSLGGGGGAGEVVVSTVTVSTDQTVTLGAGGLGGNSENAGGDGGSTSVGAISADGGGGGGGRNATVGRDGGSGGGAGARSGAFSLVGGTGTPGGDGGDGFDSGGFGAGGGGGATGDGVDGTTSTGGDGGPGYDASAFGLGTVAGGGGAGAYDVGGGTAGSGAAGGGDGSNSGNGTSATANSGSGGGGSGFGVLSGGAGGSGVAAFRYLATEPVPEPEVPTVRRSEIVWVYGLNGTQRFALRDVEGLTIEDRLEEVSSISFTIRASDPRAGLLLPDVMLRWRDRYFRLFELDQSRGSRGATVRVYGEALWTDLGRKVRFGNFPVLAKKAHEGLVAILKGTGWSAGDDPDPSSELLFSAEGFDESVLAHARRWAEITGYELAFDTATKTVSLVESVGEDRGVGFRYGSNVTEIRRRYEPPRATVLYPVGANSLTIESVHPDGEQYVEDFSWYVAQGLTTAQARTLHTKEEVWLDTNYLTPLPLYDRGIERLAVLAQPIISYEANVVDLSAAVGTIVPFEIGDLVKVRDETFDVDIATRIVRRVYRPNESGGDEVELSYLRPTGGEESTASRERDYGNVSILVAESAALPSIGVSATDWGAIQYNSTGSASTIVTGATFRGTATGDGRVRHSLIVDAVQVGPEYEFDFVDGELVEFSFPSFVADVDEGSHTVSWRVQVISGSGTIALEAGHGRGWILTTGAFGLGVNTSPNRRVVEEVLELDPLDFGDVSDSFAVVLNGATFNLMPERDISEAENVGTSLDLDVDLDDVTDRFILPFTIGDPVFGAIGGPGQIPS